MCHKQNWLKKSQSHLTSCKNAAVLNSILSLFFSWGWTAAGTGLGFTTMPCWWILGRALVAKSWRLWQWQSILLSCVQVQQLQTCNRECWRRLVLAQFNFSLLTAHRTRQPTKLGALIYCWRASQADNLGSSTRWCKCIIFMLICRLIDASTSFPVNMECIFCPTSNCLCSGGWNNCLQKKLSDCWRCALNLTIYSNLPD